MPRKLRSLTSFQRGGAESFCRVEHVERVTGYGGASTPDKPFGRGNVPIARREVLAAPSAGLPPALETHASSLPRCRFAFFRTVVYRIHIKIAISQYAIWTSFARLSQIVCFCIIPYLNELNAVSQRPSLQILHFHQEKLCSRSPLRKKRRHLLLL